MSTLLNYFKKIESIAREKINAAKEKGSVLTKDESIELLKNCIKVQSRGEKSMGFNYQVCYFDLEDGFKISEITKMGVDLSSWPLHHQFNNAYSMIT